MSLIIKNKYRQVFFFLLTIKIELEEVEKKREREREVKTIKRLRMQIYLRFFYHNTINIVYTLLFLTRY